MNSIDNLKLQVQSASNKKKAQLFYKFFKSIPGGYGEGDEFLGLTVPQCRQIAKQFKDLETEEVTNLLISKFHEERLIALLILIDQYKKADPKKKQEIVNIYLSHTEYINNWDLVDLSSHKIIGAFLFEKDKDILYSLAKSKDLWKKRIAVISTFYFINKNYFEDSLNIATILIDDKHDLIQKAVGWMLREIGKKDLKTEEEFLRIYYRKMPRTMLRYSIERFPEEERKKYLLGLK